MASKFKQKGVSVGAVEQTVSPNLGKERIGLLGLGYGWILLIYKKLFIISTIEPKGCSKSSVVAHCYKGATALFLFGHTVLVHEAGSFLHFLLCSTLTLLSPNQSSQS